ncbi:MAG: hypothetical protein ACXWEW_03685 [Nitrososphaeraceae archaeon]
MPSKRSGIPTYNYNDSIYIFIEENITKTFKNNEKYNTKIDQWEIKKLLPTARHVCKMYH